MSVVLTVAATVPKFTAEQKAVFYQRRRILMILCSLFLVVFLISISVIMLYHLITLGFVILCFYGCWKWKPGPILWFSRFAIGILVIQVIVLLLMAAGSTGESCASSVACVFVAMLFAVALAVDGWLAKYVAATMTMYLQTPEGLQLISRLGDSRISPNQSVISSSQPVSQPHPHSVGGNGARNGNGALNGQFMTHSSPHRQEMLSGSISNSHRHMSSSGNLDSTAPPAYDAAWVGRGATGSHLSSAGNSSHSPRGGMGSSTGAITPTMQSGTTSTRGGWGDSGPAVRQQQLQQQQHPGLGGVDMSRSLIDHHPGPALDGGLPQPQPALPMPMPMAEYPRDPRHHQGVGFMRDPHQQNEGYDPNHQHAQGPPSPSLALHGSGDIAGNPLPPLRGSHQLSPRS